MWGVDVIAIQQEINRLDRWIAYLKMSYPRFTKSEIEKKVTFLERKKASLMLSLN